MDQIIIGKFIASCRKEQGMTQAVIAGLVMMFIASFIEMPVWVRAVLIIFALVMIFTVAFIAVGIEQKAGSDSIYKMYSVWIRN